MNLVPRRLAGSALVGLVWLASPAFAGGISPGNGGPLLLPLQLPPSYQDAPSLADAYAGPDPLEQRFGVHDGRFDFFSARPSDSGDFKPLLRGGVGNGGVQLQLKW